MTAKHTAVIAFLVAAIACLLIILPTAKLEISSEAATSASTSANQQFALSKYSALFDRTALPEPLLPKERAPDQQSKAPLHNPADDLRKWQYLGMANADGRVAGVFSNVSQTLILKPGDILEEFSLTALDEKKATFVFKERSVDLLPPKIIE